MNRRERREAEHARMVERVMQNIFGFCALLGAICCVCIVMSAVLHLLGVA